MSACPLCNTDVCQRWANIVEGVSPIAAECAVPWCVMKRPGDMSERPHCCRRAKGHDGEHETPDGGWA